MKQPPSKGNEYMEQENGMRLIVYSFGFKHGVPIDANYVWDVRFLPNPYWDKALRPLSGQDPQVSDYVIKSEAGERFLDIIKPLLLFIIKSYESDKREDLKVAIGCTGGRHRSVAVVEAIGSYLAVQSVVVDSFHRDLDREDNG